MTNGVINPTTWQDVVPITTCPRCGAVRDQPCWDMRYRPGRRHDHPLRDGFIHRDRIDLAKRGLIAHRRHVDQLKGQP